MLTALAAVLDQRPIHSGWNRVVMVRVRTARGAVIERVVEDHGMAAAVLPYDAVRRVALLVRQLRVPLLLAHGEQSLLEAPAGLIDEADPAGTARREAMEEAGLRLHDLQPAGAVYSMPGVGTERIHLFLAEYGAQDRIAAGGGLAAENEEIAVTEVALSDLAAMADEGRLADLKTLALVQTLRLRRPDLFA